MHESLCSYNKTTLWKTLMVTPTPHIADGTICHTCCIQPYHHIRQVNGSLFKLVSHVQGNKYVCGAQKGEGVGMM